MFHSQHATAVTGISCCFVHHWLFFFFFFFSFYSQNMLTWWHQHHFCRSCKRFPSPMMGLCLPVQNPVFWSLNQTWLVICWVQKRFVLLKKCILNIYQNYISSWHLTLLTHRNLQKHIISNLHFTLKQTHVRKSHFMWIASLWMCRGIWSGSTRTLFQVYLWFIEMKLHFSTSIINFK